MKTYLILCLCLMFRYSNGNSDQMEFYLPYSETEDVDFSISRTDGCYQWSSEAIEMIKLAPILTDYGKMCGHVLEFQIVPKTANPDGETVITIVAENVNAESLDLDTPSMYEYTLRISPVSKMEIIGLKRELKVGSEPTPYGVTAYDKDGNEFDTLDGLQILWLIGSTREIVRFKDRYFSGSSTYVIPVAAGEATIIAMIQDPNYKNKLDYATLSLKVIAPLVIKPDGAYLLPQGQAKVQLFSELKGVSESNTQLQEINLQEEKDLYSIEVEDPQIAHLDKDTHVITAVKEDGDEEETTLLVKDKEGHIIRRSPIRIVRAKRITLKSYPNPENNRLVLGNEYEIRVEIFDKNDRPIYPSENILCKLSLPRQFDILAIEENGLSAKVRASSVGVGKAKANLRSVLTPDDEEIEITPHVRASTNFEIYEAIKLEPKETILPWDENVKPSYNLFYKASGGSKVYNYSVDNVEMAMAENSGKIITHGGPGSFKVRVQMANNEDSYDESFVHILEPKKLNIMSDSPVECSTGSSMRIPLIMFTLLPDFDEDLVSFMDCADVPFDVQFEDNENFHVKSFDDRGTGRIGGACQNIYISCNKPGTTSEVFVKYAIPSTGEVLQDSKKIQCFSPMKILHPLPDQQNKESTLTLSIGSSSKLIISGGILPWHLNPETFFRQVEIDDPEILLVKRTSPEKDYEMNIYEVTCLKLGNSAFSITIGNKASSDNPYPMMERRHIDVRCNIPAKIYITPKSFEGSKMTVDFGTGKVVAKKDEVLSVVATVKDKFGNTFDSVRSLKFDIDISDAGILQSNAITHPNTRINGVDIPEKPYYEIKSLSKEGNVDVTVSISGYDEGFLKNGGFQNPDPLPVIEDDEDEEEGSLIYSDTIEFSIKS